MKEAIGKNQIVPHSLGAEALATTSASQMCTDGGRVSCLGAKCWRNFCWTQYKRQSRSL